MGLYNPVQKRCCTYDVNSRLKILLTSCLALLIFAGVQIGVFAEEQVCINRGDSLEVCSVPNSCLYSGYQKSSLYPFPPDFVPPKLPFIMSDCGAAIQLHCDGIFQKTWIAVSDGNPVMVWCDGVVKGFRWKQEQGGEGIYWYNK